VYSEILRYPQVDFRMAENFRPHLSLSSLFRVPKSSDHGRKIAAILSYNQIPFSLGLRAYGGVLVLLVHNPIFIIQELN
jgi:hypothetical protein